MPGHCLIAGEALDSAGDAFDMQVLHPAGRVHKLGVAPARGGVLRRQAQPRAASSSGGDADGATQPSRSRREILTNTFQLLAAAGLVTGEQVG